MRSSFITLTLAAVCLLGSSLASPVYVKRDLGLGETVSNVGTTVGGTVGQGLHQTVQSVGQGIGNIVDRGVRDDATNNLGDSLSK
ncbi:hypothetical protein RMATCC62417_16010 [Rhizopus microsporus]|nr:hypothetical protein RMATCC62417_16010 [Rhizopus microsporus]